MLTACAEVFRLNGYSRTTMGDLAQAAGMSRPALYLVFPRKEQLFSTLLREASEAGSPIDGELGPGLSAGSYDALIAWLVWACGLWTGRDRRPVSAVAELCSPHGKYSEHLLIETLLCEGVCERLPLGDRGARAADVARLIATCMRGLSEIPLDEAERRRLLALQVESVAKAAGWMGRPGLGRHATPSPM